MVISTFLWVPYSVFHGCHANPKYHAFIVTLSSTDEGISSRWSQPICLCNMLAKLHHFSKDSWVTKNNLLKPLHRRNVTHRWYQTWMLWKMFGPSKNMACNHPLSLGKVVTQVYPVCHGPWKWKITTILGDKRIHLPVAVCSPPHSGRKRLILVGGFNPSEKYQSKWESSPGMKIKHIWNHHLVFHNPKNHQLLKTGGETGDSPPKKALRNKGVKQKKKSSFWRV